MREYETIASIPENLELRIQLPRYFRLGATVVLRIQEQEAEGVEDHMQPAMKEFLDSLPMNTGGGRTKEEIDHYLEVERNCWD